MRVWYNSIIKGKQTPKKRKRKKAMKQITLINKLTGMMEIVKVKKGYSIEDIYGAEVSSYRVIAVKNL